MLHISKWMDEFNTMNVNQAYGSPITQQKGTQNITTKITKIDDLSKCETSEREKLTKNVDRNFAFQSVDDKLQNDLLCACHIRQMRHPNFSYYISSDLHWTWAISESIDEEEKNSMRMYATE